jgi:hypothetical protein
MKLLPKEDRELLYELVEWYGYTSRPWKMGDLRAWRILVERDLVAYAPEGHVYPLERAIAWVTRSIGHRKQIRTRRARARGSESKLQVSRTDPTSP